MGRKCSEVVVLGVSFKNAKEACIYYNISYSTVCDRRKKSGKLFSEIIEDILSSRFITDGITFQNTEEACKYFNVPSDKVRKLIRESNISVDEAILSVKNALAEVVIINGKEFSSVREACKYFNVNYNTVITYKSKYNMSYNEAINKLLQTKCKNNGFVVNGLTFKSWLDACNYFNVSYYSATTIVGRENISWEDCINRLIKHNSEDFVVGGVAYKNISNACKDRGKNLNTVLDRISVGYSIDEAFDLAPRCVDGIIDKKQWNSKSIAKVVKILEIVGGKVYKCSENNKVIYYSKEEMFEKWEELKGDS